MAGAKASIIIFGLILVIIGLIPVIMLAAGDYSVGIFLPLVGVVLIIIGVELILISGRVRY